MWAQKFTEVHGCSNEEASQTIHPEVHSEWGRGPQSPDPRNLPYLLQTRIVAVYLINYLTVMSVWEWVLLLKCSATGDSWVPRCAMSYLWLLILQRNGCPILPLYCWPHLPHVIKYITLEDLQEALAVTLIILQACGWRIHLWPAVSDRIYTWPPHTDSCLAHCKKRVLARPEPGDPSNSLGGRRQLAVVQEMPSVVAPRYEGQADIDWWSIEKMANYDGMWPPKVYKQYYPGSV